MEMAPGQPLMSRDNLDSMKVDNVASGRLPGLQALGIQPASLQAIAPLYLGPGPGDAVLVRRKTVVSSASIPPRFVINGIVASR